MVKKIHFMGIAGSGVSGVADLARKMGYQVSGCDLTTGGHDPKHLQDTDLVVVTPAIFYQSLNHPEVIEAKKRGILLTWQEFLGKYLQKGKKVICIAGTHGKSTTTAMAGKLLVDAGFDPLVIVGAKVPEWRSGSRFGRGKYFVCEADEFFDNFLNYRPEIIILNNIEFDHPDYFKSEDQIFASFRKFISNLVGEKVLIVNMGDKGARELLTQLDPSRINLVKVDPYQKSQSFKLKIFGNHNQTNAQMVSALGEYLKIDKKIIKKSLESFTGISRRMELIASHRGIKIYDDYAHHPTAIAVTLAGLKERFPKSRIWVIVEPHGYARTKALLSFYQNIFQDAERVIIGPIFKARDSQTFGMTPQKIAKQSGHSKAIGVDSLDQIIKIIQQDLRPGDIILVMGAGQSNLWAKKIADSIK